MKQVRFLLVTSVITFLMTLTAFGSDQYSLYLGKILDFKERPLNVSVVTLDKAKELFSLMASQKHIPFRYARDGCYSRAHEMAYLLEDMGVIVGKAIAQGKLSFKTPNDPKGIVYWRYHIAPFILVKNNDKEQVYIIDPSVLKSIAPVNKWEDVMTANRGSRLYRTLLTNRFVYSQKYLKEDPVEYIPKNIRHARWFLKQLTKKQQDIDNGIVPTRKWPWGR